jgi:hypothetical protein
MEMKLQRAVKENVLVLILTFMTSNRHYQPKELFLIDPFRLMYEQVKVDLIHASESEMCSSLLKFAKFCSRQCVI